MPHAMNPTLTIRLARPDDRGMLLGFIEETGFEPRDADTWDGLRMLAMTAWEGEKLVGAIPLEPRQLQVAPGTVLLSMHETVVAVRPEYRGRGVGTQLQQAVFDQAGDAALVTAFCGEPDSRAYGWYIQNGFLPAMRIDSWFWDEPREAGEAEFQALDPLAPGVDWNAIESLRQASTESIGGIVSRQQRTLRMWLPIHPYHGKYTFRLLTLGGDVSSPQAFALLGIGAMDSQTTRVDVLEFCMPPAQWDRSSLLLRAIGFFAAINGYKPVRWPISQNDPLTRIAKSSGMEVRGTFDMLARALSPAGQYALDPRYTATWRYAGIDYA